MKKRKEAPQRAAESDERQKCFEAAGVYGQKYLRENIAWEGGEDSERLVALFPKWLDAMKKIDEMGEELEAANLLADMAANEANEPWPETLPEERMGRALAYDYAEVLGGWIGAEADELEAALDQRIQENLAA